jgi:hypothetical protein
MIFQTATEGLSNHDITSYLVSGLAVIVGGFASVIFSWLRTDIRNLAEAIQTLSKEFHEHRDYFAKVEGRLQGQGVLK